MIKKRNNYTKLSLPYNNLLEKKPDFNVSLGEQEGIGISNSDFSTPINRSGGSVAHVVLKSEGNATDIWIKNYIRSINWKPKSVGFYIDGHTGKAEFSNIYISGMIKSSSGIIGGFEIGIDYIRDIANTMGMFSDQINENGICFWAGTTFANRTNAPLYITKEGLLRANNVIITGGQINGEAVEDNSINGSKLIDDSVDESKLMYPTLNGVGIPNFIAGKIGQIYIDTNPVVTADRVYIAIGTDSISDWLIVSAHGITLSTSIYSEVLTDEFVIIKTNNYFDLIDSVTVSENFIANISAESFIYDSVTVSENFIANISAESFIYETITIEEDICISII